MHVLRKESGSFVASKFGIEEARAHLGHRDIGTTSSHYVAKKKRIEVSFSDGALAIRCLPDLVDVPDVSAGGALAEGGEGLILLRPGAGYSAHRVSDVLKVARLRAVRA